MVCYTFSLIVLIKIAVIVVGDGRGGSGGGGGGGSSQIKLGDTNMRWHVLFVLSVCGVRNMMCASVELSLSLSLSLA